MAFAYQFPEVLPLKRAAYSDRTAWLMAECAQLAYQDPKRLERSLAMGGFTLIKTIDDPKTDTQAYIAKRSGFAVLAFRGTESESFKDVKTDLHGGLHDTEQGGIRRGFHKAYEAVADEIKAGLAEVNGLPFYITGHSLGAALAVIATRDLDDDDLAACYTFGCPRVGDAEFDISVRAPVYRVVNAADGVTRVPPMAFGYRHVGDLRYLTRNGRLIRSPNMLRVMGRMVRNLLSSGKVIFRDHAIQAYVDKLAGVAPPTRHHAPAKTIVLEPDRRIAA